MNNWAKEGDLVFIIMDDEEIIPAKITKIDYKIPEKNNVLHFEAIEYERITLPKHKETCILDKVGYRGGFVFRRKENAEDYLQILKEEGIFTMSSVINRKAKRNQAKQMQKIGIPNIEQIKQEAANKAVNQIQSTVVAALLLAMNSELGIGASRGEKVIGKMNELIETVSPEELKEMVDKKLKVKLK